jgi:phthalate 3,4-dioxygenase beta subunit
MVSTQGAPHGTGTRLRHDDPEYIDVCMFLLDEAALMDDFDLEGWLALLASEVTYAMPVQLTRQRSDAEAAHGVSYLFQENRSSLELRAKRLLGSDSAWSESPPSRMRRFVSNVRVWRQDSGDLQVHSYELALRSRGDRQDFAIMSAARDDLLVRDGDGSLKMRRREITIDQSRLGWRNLPLPF